jgi:hypothetical protein
MKIVEEYRGYTIVETDWTTTVKVGFDEEEVRSVYIIRGLKERPSRPFLTSVEQCREYIDGELEGRAAVDLAMSETWEARVRMNGTSQAVTVPAAVMRRLGLEVGDEVRVTVSKL